jgi:hypothetical protein
MEKIKLFTVEAKNPLQLIQGGEIDIFAEINFQQYMTEKEMEEFMENINNCLLISQSAAQRVVMEDAISQAGEEVN